MSIKTTDADRTDVSSMSRSELETQLRSYRELFSVTDHTDLGFNPIKLLQGCPVGVTVTKASDDQPILFANDHFCQLTGYDREEIVGRNCRFLQGDETEAETVAQIRRAIQNGEQFEGVITNYRKDGEKFANELTIAPIRDSDGGPVLFVGFQKDVTRRREYRSELVEKKRELNKKVELLDAVNDHLPGVVYKFEVSPDGEYTFPYVSDGYEAIAGVSSEEAMRDFDAAVQNIASDQLEEVMQSTEEAIEHETPWEQELTFQWPDGTVRHALGRSVPVDRPGEGGVYNGVLIDVTERRKLSKKLQLQNMRRELAQQLADIGHWVVADDGSVTWSDEVFDIVEHDPDSGPPDTLDDAVGLYVDGEQKRVREHIQAGFNGDRFDIVSKIITPSGTVKDVRLIGKPLYDNGNITEVFGVFSDITESKTTERKLQSLLSEKQALIGEVHHRVRNNMQIILSLIGMERRRAEDDDTEKVLTDIRNRINAMSSVHEHLYQGEGLQQINAQTYIKDLVHFIECGSSRATDSIDYAVDEVGLTMDQAVPLGIVLNEAITLASYDAETKQTCSVGVRFENDSNEYCLRIKTDRAIDGEGLGRTIMERLSRDQLNGSIIVDDRKITITIPSRMSEET